MATLSSWTSLLVTCIKTSSKEIATVICHITMFLLVTTTYSKEVPSDYNRAEFLLRNGKIHGLGGFFFSLSLTGAISMGLGKQVPCHSQHLDSEGPDSLSVSHYLFQHSRACPPALHSQRGLQPPRHSTMAFRGQCYKFFVEYLRSYIRTRVHRSDLNKDEMPRPLE